jgi:hypothetical protein
MMIEQERATIAILLLARYAPDLYCEFLSDVSKVDLPARGPRGSVQNFDRVKRMAAAYDEALRKAWSTYIGRS